MRLIIDIQKQLPNYTLDVAFELAGETLGVLGSSGSGKSMTLRCIAGIETPTHGTIVLNDRILYDSRKGLICPAAIATSATCSSTTRCFPTSPWPKTLPTGCGGWARGSSGWQSS